MARYTVRHSYVNIVGTLWMPSTIAAMPKTLSGYDIENIKGHSEDGQTIDRESVEQWLTCNSGDFQCVQDFEASIEDGDATIDIPWNDPDSEMVYCDCLYQDEDN